MLPSNNVLLHRKAQACTAALRNHGNGVCKINLIF